MKWFVNSSKSSSLYFINFSQACFSTLYLNLFMVLGMIPKPLNAEYFYIYNFWLSTYLIVLPS